ncbi:MAG TPA: NACHT domain-containing protein, partial [Thermodesulfovibrionia bacterium]|nr:NACHT domain-containing protein [Thermodesulfovibrionia bacterium]
AEEIRERLPQEFIKEELRFSCESAEGLNLYRQISAIFKETDKTGGVIFVFGLDELPPEDRKKAINILNWQRGKLRVSGYSVVLWVRPETPGELGKMAPDFYSWRSEVFDFDLPGNSEKREKALSKLRLFAPATSKELRMRYRNYVEHQYKRLHIPALLQAQHVFCLTLDDVFVPRSLRKSDFIQFKITDQSIENLRSEGVKYDVLDGLKSIINQEFISEDDLVKTLITTIGEDETFTYKSLILKHAYNVGTKQRRLIESAFVPLNQSFNEWDSKDWQDKHEYSPKPHNNFYETIRENKHLVLLGEPGSGKSTLLYFLALAFAKGQEYAQEYLEINEDLIPILISLSSFSEELNHNPDLTLYEFLTLYFRNQRLRDLSSLFKDVLTAGQAIVLLDGLNEMLTSEDYLKTTAKVSDFVTDYSKNRIIITSRIAGYTSKMLPSSMATFSIEPFNDGEIELFTVQWSRAIENMRDQSLLNSTKKTEDNKFVQRQKYYTEIPLKRHTTAEQITSNPLLLTLITLIHYQISLLPESSVKLYGLCIEALAKNWNLASMQPNSQLYVYLQQKRIDEPWLIRMFAPIAYWLHKKRPTGLISRNELKDRIKKHLIKDDALTDEQAALLANDLINLVRKNNGLIVERAPGSFSFIHQSIQEYLAARYLSEQNNCFDLLKPYLHNYRWLEVILLTVGWATHLRRDNFINQ